MRRLKSTLIYLGLIGFAGSSAMFLATSVLRKAHSQTKNALPPPSDGELPAEFLQDNAKPSKDAGKAAQKAAPPSAPAKVDSKADAISKAETKPAPPTEVPNASTLSLVKDDFVYDPNGKRDPFRQRVIRQVKVENQQIEDFVEPLQKYVLSQLKVVAIMWEIKNPRAVVRDPDGGSHIVSKNTKIGSSKGVVSAIREGEIVVIETVNREGGPRKEVQVLSLKK